MSSKWDSYEQLHKAFAADQRREAKTDPLALVLFAIVVAFVTHWWILIPAAILTGLVIYSLDSRKHAR